MQRNGQHYVVETPDDFMVSTAAYRGEEVFQRELKDIFYSTWIYLCHESEIPNEGDYKATWIGRQPVLVVRTASTVNAFLNICTHRGAVLCREERGSARTFVCPYHGWSFDNDGKLVGISDEARYPDGFPAERKALKKVAKVAVYHGLVFGSMTADVPDLDDYLGAAKKHLELWLGRTAGGTLRVAEAHKYSYHGNWKFQAENVLDGYHAPVVHRSAYRTMKKYPSIGKNRIVDAVRKIGATSGYPGGHGTVEAGVPLESTRLDPAVRQAYIDKLTEMHGAENAQEIVNNRHLLIFPNVVLMDMNIRVIQPISHDYTEIYSFPLLIDEMGDHFNFARLHDVQSRVGTAGIVGADDIEIFNGNQTALDVQDAWITLSRGLGKEAIHPSGERVGEHADETPQRAFWRQWQLMMDRNAEGAAA